MNRLLLTLALIAAFTLAGCASIPIIGQQPCPEQAKEFIAEADRLAVKWDDANKIASSTPRISLAPVISNLQEIRRETAELTAPECAKNVQNLIVDYMDKTIDAYLGFMAQKPEVQMNVYYDQSKQALEQFSAEFTKLKKGQEPYN